MQRLKKAGGSISDLKQFYISVIRPICEYAAPVWSTNLTVENSRTIENIQKRAIKIIFPDNHYAFSLKELKLTTLQERRLDLCKSFFKKIQNPDDKINHLLVCKEKSKYDLRKDVKYKIPRTRTNRYKNSFIPYALNNFQV